VNLLFDQNISHRVVLALQEHIPTARHVRDFELQFAKDREIWRFAKDNDYTIVTFDSDFNDLATLYGHPPKIIWLRFGNTLTQHMVSKIVKRADLIMSFISDPSFADVSCLEIDS
jgi:predicted nuclease of predicted toxin-antitoxin system